MKPLSFSDDSKPKSRYKALDCGEAGGADPPLHHALVPVYELQLGKTEQVLGVIHTLGGALRSHLPVINDNKECAAKVGLLLIFVRLRFRDSAPSRDGQRFSPLADYKEAIVHLWRRQREVLQIMVLSMIPNTILHPVWFLLPLFTAQLLHSDTDMGGYLRG